MKIGCRRFKGFTILSVIAGLLISIILTVAIYRYAQDAKERSHATELINAIRTVKASAMRHFAPDKSQKFLYQKLKAEKAVPFDWEPYDAATRWNTPLWGNFFVGPLVGGYDAYSPAVISATDAMLITVASVDKDICFRVIQGIESEFDFIALDNSDRRIIKNYDLPFNHANANTECEQSSGRNVWLGLMVY